MTPNLIEPMAKRQCECAICIVERGVRQGCGFTGAETLTPAEMEALINGLARVMSEVMAHLDDQTAHVAAAWMLEQRQVWQHHPRVMVHAEPQGRA